MVLQFQDNIFHKYELCKLTVFDVSNFNYISKQVEAEVFWQTFVHYNSIEETGKLNSLSLILSQKTIIYDSYFNSYTFCLCYFKQGFVTAKGCI